MEIAIFWLILALVVGVAAGSRGRSGFGWFLIAILLSPLIAIIILLVLPKLGEAGAPRSPSGDVISERTHTRCPACMELVRRDAVKCRHCGESLTPQRIQPGTSEAEENAAKGKFILVALVILTVLIIAYW